MKFEQWDYDAEGVPGFRQFQQQDIGYLINRNYTKMLTIATKNSISLYVMMIPKYWFSSNKQFTYNLINTHSLLILLDDRLCSKINTCK